MIKEQLNRLSKSAFVYGLGQVLNRFIGFLLLPLFTAYLSPADYGIIALLGLVTFIATSLFSLGLSGAMGICYYDGNSQTHKEQTIWTSFFILLISACVLSVCAILFPRQISLVVLKTQQYDHLIVMTLLSAGMTILTSPFMLYLQFEERAKLFVILTMITTLFAIALSCFLVVCLKRGVNGMVESTLIASIAGFLLFVSFVCLKLRVHISYKVCRQLLELGLPLVPAFVMLFVIQHGNKYILQWFSGLNEVGIYNIGFNIGMAMSLLVSALQSAWFPFFMSFVDKHEEAGVLFGRILTYYVFIFGSISLFFFIFAKPVIMVMTQPEFHEAYKIVGLSAGASFLSGVFFILLPGLYFAKDVKYVSIIQMITAVIATGLNILLIPVYGLLGAGIALMIGFLVMVIILQLWNYLKRTHYIIIIYDYKRLAYCFSSFTAFIIITLWERHFTLFHEFLFSLILSAILTISVYLLLTEGEKYHLRSLINDII